MNNPIRTVLLRATEQRDLPAPEAMIEEDGDFCFDWFIAPNASLSVSVSESGQVGWSALIKDYKSYGTFQLPDWSEEFNRALTQLENV